MRSGAGSDIWWRRGGSNSRPSHCERDALPAELRPQKPRILAPPAQQLAALAGLEAPFGSARRGLGPAIEGPVVFTRCVEKFYTSSGESSVPYRTGALISILDPSFMGGACHFPDGDRAGAT